MTEEGTEPLNLGEDFNQSLGNVTSMEEGRTTPNVQPPDSDGNMLERLSNLKKERPVTPERPTNTTTTNIAIIKEGEEDNNKSDELNLNSSL